MNTYVFTDDLEEMRNRLNQWYKMLIAGGCSHELAVSSLKELYLKCGEVYNWPLEFYYSMVETAAK